MLTALNSLFGRRGSSSSTGNGGSSSASSTRGEGSAYPVNSIEGGSTYPPREGEGGSTNAASLSVPRVKHSMARIKSLIRRMNPELLDTLEYPASSRQIAQLQAALRDYLVPKDVLESYSIHDGQDSFSVPRSGENGEIEGATGFIYGLWWMTVEEVITEYQFWRRLDISTPPSPATAKRTTTSNAKGKGKQKSHTAKAPSQDAFLFGSEMDPRTVRGRMGSCPEGYVREEYSHPSWLPLLKDGYGNYIGIDLDPPSLSHAQAERAQIGNERILPGRGQVIAFGREIDVKTVLWNGWADTNAYDNLGGGGWARFLASYADDLSSSSTLHSDARSRMNDDEYTEREDEEDDESAYRASQGGRQEILHNRGSQGLEWLDNSQLFSGLGTIEALVERSKRHWAAVGLYSLEGEGAHNDGDDDDETAAGDTSGVYGDYPAKLGAGIERQHKPAPLHLAGDEDEQTLNEQSGTITTPSVASETAPLGGSAGLPDEDGFVDVPTSAGINSFPSPEPSLILSPPSPKDNAETFQSFPLDSPPRQSNPNLPPASPETPLASATARTQQQQQQPPRRPSVPSSPTIIGGALASPSRMSPNQLARFEERERQRTTSNTSTSSRQPLVNGMTHQSSSSASFDAAAAAAQRRKSSRGGPPPPVAMPLGLPTLEFGNGIWEYGDTDVADISNEGPGAYSPAGFSGQREPSGCEVVVDRR